MKLVKCRYAVATSALVTATLGASVLASSGGAHAAARGPHEHTLHLVERGGAVRFVDSAPPRAHGRFDFSPGDQAIITRTLDRANGTNAGSLQLACTAITATDQHCTGTIELSGGTLEVAGISSPSPTTTVAIVGGTGAYARQTGTGYAADRPGHSDVADLTITLAG